MKNSKLFASLNDEKGLLLQVKDGSLSVSIWKKETPISAILDQDSAVEICEFITSNLKSGVNEEENQRKIELWKENIDKAKNWQAEGAESKEGN
jgi:hypothetical protein